MLLVEVREYFFNAEKVIAAMDDGRRRALSQGGAFVRQTARQSMRRRSKPSDPGKPPRVVDGRLKKFTFFAWDPKEGSVFVGPVQLGQSVAPNTLEFGGTQRATNRLIPVTEVGRSRTGQFQSRRRFVRYTGTVKVQARPFMGPALDKNIGKIPEQFRNVLRSS